MTLIINIFLASTGNNVFFSSIKWIFEFSTKIRFALNVNDVNYPTSWRS